MNDQNDTPQKLAQPAPADETRYVVGSRLEIASILRAVMESHALVSAYFNQENDFILTSILHVGPETGQMILDYGAIEEFNRKMLGSEKIIFITSQDRVKIKFAANRVERTRFEGRDAFRVALPESLVRLQRRQYYRVITPLVKPLKCSIPLPPGTAEPGRDPRQQAATADVMVLDISCGGIAVIDHHPRIDLEPGATFQDCRIVLPGIGTVVATIRVRNTFEVTMKNGGTCKRSGCEFVNPPANMMALIQRYIIKLEQERNARRSGLG